MWPMRMVASLSGPYPDPMVQPRPASACVMSRPFFPLGTLRHETVQERRPAPDRELAARAVWFAALVPNAARTPRTPTPLLWPGRLWLIDHGAALFSHHAPEPVPGQAGREPPAELAAVREALRNFRVPHELARSPLARGNDPQERAESVRRLLRDAAEHAFGDSANEKLLRSVLIKGYLDPAPSHEHAAMRLSLSRAAYFRRLRTAVERVAEHVAGHPPAPAGTAGPALASLSGEDIRAAR